MQVAQLQCVVTDLDGTLLNSDGRIAEENKKAAFLLKEKGIKLILATGRAFTTTERFVDELQIELPCINANGGMLYDYQQKKPVYMRTIPKERCEQLISLFQKLKYHYFCYTPEGMFTTIGNPRIPFFEHYNELYGPRYSCRLIPMDSSFIPAEHEIVKILVTSVDEKIRQMLETKYNSDHFLNMAYSARGSLDINTVDATKGIALQYMSEHYNFGLTHTLAVGDHENDVSMLSLCGYAAAMGNAMRLAKQAADYIAKDNDHQGFADAVYHYIDRG